MTHYWPLILTHLRVAGKPQNQLLSPAFIDGRGHVSEGVGCDTQDQGTAR